MEPYKRRKEKKKKNQQAPPNPASAKSKTITIHFETNIQHSTIPSQLFAHCSCTFFLLPLSFFFFLTPFTWGKENADADLCITNFPRETEGERDMTGVAWRLKY